MANKISTHISNALHKRKQKHEEKVSLPDVSDPSTLSETQNNDAVLEKKLDQIISKEQESEQEQNELETPPLPDAIPITISSDEISSKYKDLYNGRIAQNEGDPLLAHQQAIQTLLNDYANNDPDGSLTNNITQVCENTRTKFLKTLHICTSIDKQLKLFADFLEALQLIPDSSEKDKLIAFFKERENVTSFQKIKVVFEDVITKEIYVDDDDFITQLIQYAKDLVLLTPYEYGMLIYIMLQNPTLHNPYESKEIKVLNTYIEEFIINCPTPGLEKIARFIHHSLEFNMALMNIGKMNMFLTKINFSKMIKSSIEPFIEDAALLTTLQTKEDVNAPITHDLLVNLTQELTSYQELLNEYGKARILASIKIDELSYLKELQTLHQNIEQRAKSFGMVRHLKKTLSNFTEPELEKIKENIDMLIKALHKIEKDLSALGVDRYSSQTIIHYRIGRGDFFKEEDREHLRSATYALHSIINPIKLFNIFIKNFKQYTPEQQTECLLFVKNYLLLDTKNNLISVKYEKSEIIDRIDMFCQYVISVTPENTTIEELSNEISNILINKIIAKGKTFSEYLSNISKGKIPHQHLLRRLNTIKHDFQNHVNDTAQIEEYFLEINFILDSPNLLDRDDIEHNDKINSTIEYFCNQLGDIPAFANSATELKNKLIERFNVPVLQDLPQSPILEIPESIHFNINSLLFDVLQGDIMMAESEKSLLSTIDAIERGFSTRFAAIDISELREQSWRHDEKRIHEGLTPFAPNVRKYYQYFSLIQKYFTLALLYDVEKGENKLIPRDSLYKISHLKKFMEKAICRALDNGANATAIVLDSVLKQPEISRLLPKNREFETVRNEQFKKMVNDNKPLDINILEKNALPFLGLVQSQITKEYELKFGSEFERRVYIGQKLQFLEELKQNINQSTNTELAFQIVNFMTQHELLLSVVVMDDILVDQVGIQELASSASYELKPNEFKSYQLSDFHSISELKDILTFWYNRMEDYHFITKNPEKKIMEFIEEQIANDEDFHYFESSLAILNLIDLINASKQRSYKSSESDLYRIFSLYYNKALAILKNEMNEASEVLDVFFAIFNNHPKVKMAHEEDVTSLNPFSAHHNLIEIIKKIDKLKIKYTKSIEMLNESRGQMSYSELLIKVLEGGSQEPILHFGTSVQSEVDTSTSLLPDTEFPVPQAEPEHPDYIGINRTMNFNPDSKYRSVLDIFSTIELKKDFFEAFPWSIDINTIQKLENTKLNQTQNLLATESLFSPQHQIAVMNYVLLSLDCLGKISGYNGELSIQNFNKIKSISDSLQDVANLLSSTILDHEVITTKIDHMTYKLVILNQDLVDMLSQTTPPYPVQNNLNMNDFCHLNEYLAHKLLGIPYQKSILSPINPYSPIMEKVSEKTKYDFLRIAGHTMNKPQAASNELGSSSETKSEH